MHVTSISTILSGCFLGLPVLGTLIVIIYTVFDIFWGDEYRFIKRHLAKVDAADWPKLSCVEATRLLKMKDVECRFRGKKEKDWYHSVDIYTKSGNYLSSFSFTSVFEAMKFNRKAKRILSKNKNLRNKINMYNKIKEELNK